MHIITATNQQENLLGLLGVVVLLVVVVVIVVVVVVVVVVIRNSTYKSDFVAGEIELPCADVVARDGLGVFPL